MSKTESQSKIHLKSTTALCNITNNAKWIVLKTILSISQSKLWITDSRKHVKPLYALTYSKPTWASIWSASSKTRILICVVFNILEVIHFLTVPGVPITTWSTTGPLLELDTLFASDDDTAQVEVMPVNFPIFKSTSSFCRASQSINQPSLDSMDKQHY